MASCVSADWVGVPGICVVSGARFIVIIFSFFFFHGAEIAYTSFTRRQCARCTRDGKKKKKKITGGTRGMDVGSMFSSHICICFGTWLQAMFERPRSRERQTRRKERLERHRPQAVFCTTYQQQSDLGLKGSRNALMRRTGWSNMVLSH